MVVRPRSQNPWQLASPRSSETAGGCRASAVGVDESFPLGPAAVRTRRLMLENILGSRSTRQGESAVPHKCLHSSATSSCRICTSPPVLHDRACSADILAPQPSQAAGISSGEWIYRRRTLSLHSSVDRPVPFNRFGNTDSHAPAAQFRLSRLATEGLSWPRASRKSCSSMSRILLAACPASVSRQKWDRRSSVDRRTGPAVGTRSPASHASRPV
jgi:hypothetical protein